MIPTCCMLFDRPSTTGSGVNLSLGKLLSTTIVELMPDANGHRETAARGSQTVTGNLSTVQASTGTAEHHAT